MASPEVYVGEDRGHQSVFADVAEAGVRMEALAEWARGFNAQQVCKLRMRENVLRLSIPDVMIVYMGYGERNGLVQVETIRVVGPREKTSSQSAYTVFQQLSQQLAKVLESEVDAKLQSVVGLLVGYGELFISRCAVCGRVVSQEGHVPAVDRRWEAGGWEWRHVGCRSLV